MRRFASVPESSVVSQKFVSKDEVSSLSEAKDLLLI
jgi:hypothetical protein